MIILLKRITLNHFEDFVLLFFLHHCEIDKTPNKRVNLF